MILVVDKKETILRYQTGCLLIEQPGIKKRRAPLNQLEQVIVYGNPMAETAVWRALANAGVPAVMLSGRGKENAAMLGSGLAIQLPLRRMQHRCADHPGTSLAMAKWFVDRKLQSYDLPLALHLGRSKTIVDDCKEFKVQRDLARVRVSQATEVNALMGMEGHVARAWFALLAHHLPYKWKFAGRNRQPPRDPVNALLSLGYTLMHSELRQAVIAGGLDPSLGFLHQVYPGRESLVLDFSEIFRSGVDTFVLGLIEDERLGADGFYYREADGCRLSKAVRPLFFKAWAQHRENWLRPFAEPGGVGDWPAAPLREQAGGQVALLREVMEAQGHTDG